MKKANRTTTPQKLTHTLNELENALNKWDEISKGLKATDEKKASPKGSTRDASLISETKKLLSKLKLQIAELDC